jgi:putative redox protein
MPQAQVAALAAGAGDGQGMDVRFVAGEAYEVMVRGHRVVVDQPADVGGQDSAPTPTELFVASLATCVAFYAGRFLTRHGYSREGLAVSAGYEMASDRPARVSNVRLTVRVPACVPPQRWAALRAVASHCTVHNSLAAPPSVSIGLQ